MEARNTYSRGSRGYSWGPRRSSLHPAQFSFQNELQGPLPSHSPLAQATNFKTSPNMNGLNLNLSPRNPTIPKKRLPSIPNPNSPLSPSACPFNQKPTTNYKRLTHAKLQAKIEKGLCFRCDAKFSPGHKCKNKRLQVLLVQGNFTEEEIAELGGGDERQTEEVEEIIELSINSVVGLSTPKTMKIEGKIDQQ